MIKLTAPIGVLDSGVGGLSVLKCLHRLLPHEDFIYVGDTARTPYGTRPEGEIRSFVEEMLSWLAARGVKQVVVACNTLTMLGVESLRGGRSFAVTGMSRGEELLLAASRSKRLGVLATPFTIAAGAHKEALLAAEPEAAVYAVPCPDFVPLIEGEQLDGPELRAAAAGYTAPLRQAGVDAVLLACTHYPFIRQQLEEELGGGVTLIDPAEATALMVRAELEHQELLRSEGGGGLTICATADIERVRRLAGRMLPQEACVFEEISLLKK